MHSPSSPPKLIPAPANNVCKVHGCRSPSQGKSYCRRHTPKGRAGGMVFTVERRSHMRSVCCNAACADGKQHEYGKQYCGRCKEPCCWHA
ncbi:MAG: hypothetical protein WC840_03050 [Candidatus Peribacteraceae bacterium]